MIDETSNYLDLFSKEFSLSRKFKFVSEIDPVSENKFSVLTIGDSFSQQNEIGYQNYLANDTISVLHFREIGNSIQTLYGLINGNIFEKLAVDYVILQSAERKIVSLTDNLDSNYVISNNEMISIENRTLLASREGELENKKNNFFSDVVIKFPLYNFLFLFDDNAINAQVYKVKTDASYFSIEKKELLFYEEEIRNIKLSYDIEKINILNNYLNNLAYLLNKKNIKLIVLVSPDKYDVYYNCILNKENYPKPVFFDNFDRLSKNYEFINSRDLLRKEINKQKDIYFYDNTHWSPIGSKLIAKELRKIIQEIQQEGRKTQRAS